MQYAQTLKGLFRYTNSTPFRNFETLKRMSQQGVSLLTGAVHPSYRTRKAPCDILRVLRVLAMSEAFHSFWVAKEKSVARRFFLLLPSKDSNLNSLDQNQMSYH